jgi:hypothetical protein
MHLCHHAPLPPCVDALTARMCLSGTHLVHAAAAGITFLMLATMFVMMVRRSAQWDAAAVAVAVAAAAGPHECSWDPLQQHS